MIEAQPGATFTAALEGAPTDLEGTVGVRLEDGKAAVVLARTTAGITEAPSDSGIYVVELTAPTTAGQYIIAWDTGGESPSFAAEDLVVTYTASTTTLIAGSPYATPADLRKALKVDAQMLSDDDALETLLIACDLIDERLGIRPIDEETGRKVVLADEEAWRARKLVEATLEVAKVIYNDPGVEARQRARFASGDVSVSGFFGPAFGERAEALLNQSGLRVNTARMRGSGRRWRR